MKKFVTVLALALAVNLSFAAPTANDKKIGDVSSTELTSIKDSEDPLSFDPLDPFDKVGKVIAIGKDLVALGEEVYTLVQKGKPSIETDTAPVSVVPKDPSTKEAIDPFELEGFSVPVARVFQTKIKNKIGLEVINFTYKLIYSYGGSYDGKGKYLTGVQIVPVSVTAKYGWDVKAEMKVLSVLNHGTKDSPVAGLIVNIKYTMKSWGRAEERNHSFHMAGNGGMKDLGIK